MWQTPRRPSPLGTTKLGSHCGWLHSPQIRCPSSSRGDRLRALSSVGAAGITRSDQTDLPSSQFKHNLASWRPSCARSGVELEPTFGEITLIRPRPIKHLRWLSAALRPTTLTSSEDSDPSTQVYRGVGCLGINAIIDGVGLTGVGTTTSELSIFGYA